LRGESLKERGLQTKKVFREMGLIVVASVLVFVTCYQLGLSDKAVAYIVAHGDGAGTILDEAILTLVFFCVALLIFSFRRWKESRAEALSQTQISTALSTVHNEMESQVRQRTAEMVKVNEALHLEITSRQQAEDRLKTSALRLSLATQAMQAGVWDWDVRTNVIDWDKKMYEIYGQPVNGPVTYQKWADAVVPEDFPHAEATLQRVIASKSSASAEFRITVPNGALRHIHAAEGVVLDDAGEVVRVIGVNIDTTERKNLEHQFLRSQRIESMGTLAGGIAHELNNILAPIMMSIHLLKDTPHDKDTDDILETIDHSAKRGADIVRQVLSLARGVEGERIEVQPKSLLKDLENIIKNTFPKDVRLELTIPDNTWAIWGDPTQVHQILLNLCLNARDAMPHGGRLAVRIENCALDEQYAAMNLQAKAGRYVNISVTDSGTGIPPELIDKIFEPFFTTKELNKGTGLGLSTVIAIVKSHGGIINVYSEPGNGTTFKVYMPAVEIASDARKTQSGKVSLPRGNGEMVLVVDDEPSILTITSRTLQASGYQVLTATDGANAVAVYLQHKKDIAVVLTDMAMPVMDGPAMIHALMRINPTVKIIAASGLNANGSVTKVSEPRVRHFLAKPYTAGALLKTLHVILDEAR
jgi:PAS domain S-box-containing protein